MTNPDFHIREAEDGDTDGIIAVWTACDLSRPWNDPAHDIDFCRTSTCATIFVGHIDGRIVATVMTGHDGHRGVLYYLGVHPDFRSQGFGKRMTEQAEKWLRDLGVWKLNLMIRDDNAEVQKFYQSMGFETEPRIVMSRRLDDHD